MLIRFVCGLAFGFVMIVAWFRLVWWLGLLLGVGCRLLFVGLFGVLVFCVLVWLWGFALGCWFGCGGLLFMWFRLFVLLRVEFGDLCCGC